MICYVMMYDMRRCPMLSYGRLGYVTLCYVTLGYVVLCYVCYDIRGDAMLCYLKSVQNLYVFIYDLRTVVFIQ